jgi:hypothetical protein
MDENDCISERGMLEIGKQMRRVLVDWSTLSLSEHFG